MKAKAIPEGFRALTPSLVVRNAVEAIEFYERAFGAKIRCRYI
jgi:PhnB protein